ncbi:MULTISPECIES: DeoR/GlpR family DNA-binding transcription regulator [Corynebacterium]|uniref:DeoR faimly transcriptional regulator n=2 Tax=Corynebacterium TaxID=1716 RepID=A0ACC4UD25_9CORY|nr:MULTISPECIES: DeoR/GlpR family DNA-binding transcription regulator [Corynebacterium]KKO81077.1 DeoR faimly transcriptional regulator [Corynebacterium minutissimum]MTD90823.1 DeoR/GlpR transcriptional regulator [Corynebacterium aurimucosum]OFK65976.1 DeoR family transcriptional regulator [Corynebacterium sp. HMSC076G08]OFK66035.1 DeoR family transcriptional regulator [Corynebacterium sp. HMSC074A09]OFO95629.1 DeoR family transcriptional regulator [Corynebacterium sp. HMSC034H07]
MDKEERQRRIIWAVDSGSKTVNQLQELTGASAITIRRDLTELEEAGALTRFHGGARPAVRRGARYPLEVRRKEDPAGKRAIAAEAARLVEPGSCVLIDSGTTPTAVARNLAGMDITALAMSLYAGAALAKTPGSDVLIPGGTVNSDDLAVYGAEAVDTVMSMRFDLAIVGVCACTPSVGLMSPNLTEATIKRAYFKAARRVIVVTTPEKFTRMSAHRVATFDQVDTVITTTDLSPDIAQDVVDFGANLTMVPVEDS